MHPAKVQLRGFGEREIENLLKVTNAEVLKVKEGVDLYFSDVNDARFFISKLKRIFRVRIKMSTESMGFKSRGKYLFVYCLRREK
jgi:NMD protein affecting ribosome stability and mRNA decay